jgi:Flp pilus assembly protein TadG
MMTLFKRLRRDEDGAAIVELALAAPILSILVIGIVDLANAYSRKLVIEQAAQRGLERIMQTTAGGTVDMTAEQEIEQTAGLDDSDVAFSVTLECTHRTTGARRRLVVTAPEPLTGEVPDPEEESATNDTPTASVNCDDSTELRANYVQVVAVDEFTPMFPITFGANAQGRYPIRVRMGMRTQ